MDGFVGDDLHPLFPQADSYSPVHSFNAFADEDSRRAAASATHPRHGLDLNSQSEGFPYLADYHGYLQSDRAGGSGGGGAGFGGSGGSGGSSGLPPNPPRRGSGGGNRTLDLRAARGERAGNSLGRGRGGWGGSPLSRAPLRGAGRGAGQAGPSTVRQVRRRDADTFDDDVEEVPSTRQV